MPSSAASKAVEDAKDPITAEEITGEASTESPQPPPSPSSRKRPNAFTEIMSPSKKPLQETSHKPAQKPSQKIAFNALPATGNAWNPRDGLLAYIQHPEQNPEGRVIEYDDNFVVINDKYPKSSVHLLLLPRDPAYYDAHPLHLLSSDTAFLSKVRARVSSLKILAAAELRRQYGALSASDEPYQTALEALMASSDPPPAAQRDALLPPGRDWLSEIKVGVHTHPSMNHMHIHILSRDMNSPCMKHKRHYLSFNTRFLVPLEDFPLEERSERFHPGDWPSWHMKCWRCGKDFKNKFAALKQHLGDEFEVWRKE